MNILHNHAEDYNINSTAVESSEVLGASNSSTNLKATAKQLNLDTEDVLEITYLGRKIRAPVFVLPGQAADCITLPLGFGHKAGALGADIGFDAYRLRTSADMWIATGATLSRTGETYALATTQGHDRVAGCFANALDIGRRVAVEDGAVFCKGDFPGRVLGRLPIGIV